MKNLIAILILFSSQAMASVDTCSRFVGQDKRFTQAIEFLKRYEGRYKFGGCQVELHVCQTISEQDDQGDLVADMLVIDQRGREFYAPIYFLQTTSKDFWYQLKNGRIMFHYKYEDRSPAQDTLGVESIHLEILSHWDNPALKKIEMGYYMRADYVKRHRKHRYQWAECEE
ncbi:MAG: hypothetical protein AB7F86_08145 [Bdellovibrionales bacterium]